MQDNAAPADSISLTSTQTKVVTSLAFVIGTASVLAVGTLAGMVLSRTLTLTRMNFSHLIASKGRVWETTPYRNFDE